MKPIFKGIHVTKPIDMSTDTIIIIKTEEVKISELEGREKQIYDYAYMKGYSEGERAMLVTRASAILFWIVVAVVGFVYLMKAI